MVLGSLATIQLTDDPLDFFAFNNKPLKDAFRNPLGLLIDDHDFVRFETLVTDQMFFSWCNH